jgi:hypothetical protein
VGEGGGVRKVGVNLRLHRRTLTFNLNPRYLAVWLIFAWGSLTGVAQSWRYRSRRNSKAKCDGFAQLVRSRSYRSESESSYASMPAPSVTQTSKQNLRSSHAPVTLMSKTVPPDCGASKAFAYSPTSKSIAEISMSLPPTIVFTSAWQPAACPDKPQR